MGPKRGKDDYRTCTLGKFPADGGGWLFSGARGEGARTQRPQLWREEVRSHGLEICSS